MADYSGVTVTTNIIKRDGQEVTFDLSKIVNAISKANKEVDPIHQLNEYQIIAVADTFDAMYSNRPYRKRMNFEKAVSIIKEVRGTQLQDDVVDAFLRLVDKGKFRAPDDFGGGTTEDINNIHKKQKEEEKKNDGK